MQFFNNFSLKVNKKENYNYNFSRFYLNRQIMPLKSLAPSVNTEIHQEILQAFEVERRKIYDLKLKAKKKKQREERDKRRWNPKVARLVFVQFFAGISVFYKRFHTSKYNPARWKAIFNARYKVPSWVNNYYVNLKNKFGEKSSKKFFNIASVFPVANEITTGLDTLDFLNALLSTDPIYKLRSRFRRRRIKGKRIRIFFKKPIFEKLKKIPEQFLEESYLKELKKKLKKKPKKKPKKLKLMDPSRSLKKSKKKTPLQLRKRTIRNLIRRKKKKKKNIVLKEDFLNILNIFMFFLNSSND